MEVLKKLDWNIIREYMEKDLLIMQIHPTKDLFILNYSKTCQYERAWDEVTLACRGLVVNGKGDIIARSFTKFFNKEEYEAYEDLPNIPTNELFEVFEKMDGSLGLLFFYDGEWIFASRGSFMSDQAIKGREMLRNYHLESLNSEYTYIFEIIYPENRIVINYGTDEELVLLGAIHTESGKELQYGELKKINFNAFGFPIVPRYDGLKDFDKMKALNTDNKEGFVILFANSFRMKVKFEEYVRLHSIVTNVSNKIVWQHLKDGKSFEEMLNRVPDEFYDWVEKTKKELEDAYNLIEIECLCEFKNIVKNIINCDVLNRKEFALKAVNFKHSGILFSMFDDNDYSKAIWKIVRPVYGKPFMDGVDEG